MYRTQHTTLVCKEAFNLHMTRKSNPLPCCLPYPLIPYRSQFKPFLQVSSGHITDLSRFSSCGMAAVFGTDEPAERAVRCADPPPQQYQPDIGSTFRCPEPQLRQLTHHRAIPHTTQSSTPGKLCFHMSIAAKQKRANNDQRYIQIAPRPWLHRRRSLAI